MRDQVTGAPNNIHTTTHPSPASGPQSLLPQVDPNIECQVSNVFTGNETTTG